MKKDTENNSVSFLFGAASETKYINYQVVPCRRNYVVCLQALERFE